MRLIDANRINYQWLSLSDVFHEFVACKKDIDSIPEVDAEPRWIPMSERTPNVGQDVLVTTSSGRMYVVTYANKEWVTGHCFHWKPNFMGTEYLDENDVIAWMPLPERY